MKWKKIEWIETLFWSFLLYALLTVSYLLGYLPAFIFELGDTTRYLWFAVISTFLVLFQNVLDIIWNSAKYRKRLRKKKRLAEKGITNFRV